MNKSTEHIPNHDVKYYYDNVFQKMSKEIRDIYNYKDDFHLGRDEKYIALLMFEKFKIQFYSAIYLSNTYTKNPSNQFYYLDIVSIQNIIRSCYETFLTFEYIYIQPESIGKLIFPKSEFNHLETIKLKLLLYKYEGYKQNNYAFSTIPEKREINKINLQEYLKEIQDNIIFSKLDKDKQDEILENWKPSWNDIASKTELSTWNSKNMYNILCQYSHNSYSSLTTIDYYYSNLDKYDKDAMLVQLYEFTAIFINDYIRLFHIDGDIFEEDEINLLNEFYGLAIMNPSDAK